MFYISDLCVDPLAKSTHMYVCTYVYHGDPNKLLGYSQCSDSLVTYSHAITCNFYCNWILVQLLSTRC